jgi:2-methylcitrate dehydratase PrpD
MPIPLTAGLGEFVAGLRYRDIPGEAIEVIHTGFADCVGVTMVGALEPAPKILRDMLSPSGGEATVLFDGGRASALDAAWINATAGHALDYDDVALRGHPSVVLVPAILAEAQAIGASGEQMMTAYAAGYEVWAEIVWRDPDHHHKKGWHPTGVFGSIAAAAACASLHGLDAGKTTHAIGIGASQSSGLVVNFGAMAKPMQAGRAAHAGIASARLAKRGFTAAADSLEHPPGFMAAVSLGNRFDVDSPIKAGRQWRLPIDRLSVKKYPLCFAVHNALDGVLDLRTVHRIDPGQVARVKVTLNRRHVVVLRNHQPQTALEGKFSMEFAMACALLTGRAGLDQLQDDFVRSPQIRALMQRVEIVPDDEDPNRPGFAMDDRVVLEMSDGRRFDSGHLTKIRGGPELPLRRDELWAKFEDCAKVSAAPVPARELFDALMSLERLPHIKRLPGFGT